MIKKSLLLLLFLSLASFIYFHYFGKNKSGDGEPSVVAKVDTIAISKKTLTQSIETYGIVATANTGAIDIAVPRSAVITHMHVVTGQAVKKGDALFEVASDAEGSAAYTQALSAVKFAESERKRIRQLVNEQLATDSQAAATDKALQDAQGTLNAQQKLGNGVGAQTFTAPFTGIITTVSNAQGDKTTPGAVVMQLSTSSAIQIELGIEPPDAGYVKPGMKLIAWPVFGGGEPTQGTVTQIQTMIDPKTRMVTAYASLNSAKDKLLLGGNVRVRIIIASKESDAVPDDSVLNDDKGSYVFQVDKGKAKRVDVKAGMHSDGFTGIEGNFDPALPVVTTGTYELQDGMEIAPAADEAKP